MAWDVDVTRAERFNPLLFRVVAVPPDAAVVVAEQVQRHRRHVRGGADPVDVVLGQQLVEVAGPERRSRIIQPREKSILAYHEVGHALVGALMPGSGRVEKISIIPRGMAALGYTLQLPTEDRFLMSETELREQIATMLGGRSAEEIIFNSITTGASNDLQRATDLAERMVTMYGMSKVLGPLAYQQGQQSFLGAESMNPRRMVSAQTAEAIDQEVKAIVEEAHQHALDILTQNRDLLESITQKLLETEVIEGETLNEMLVQVKAPERSPVTVG